MMTPEELEIEWKYRYEERLGILCGDAEPTSEQKAIALKEANQAIIELTSSPNTCTKPTH
jgi:hypothetical protein